MGSAWSRVWVAWFSLVAALLAGCSSAEVVEARDGVLDLRSWSGEGIVVPHGEFRIDWDTLDPRSGDGERFTVPGNLGSHWPARGAFGVLQGGGCAVLGLDVLLPETKQPIAFALHSLHARVRARSLDGDGAETLLVGAPLSCDPELNDEVHYWQATALPRAKRVHLEIAVAPHLWGRPNINGRFQLGTTEVVTRDRVEHIALRVASIGTLLGLAASATVLALLRRGAAGALELAVFLAVLSLRSMAGLQVFEAWWPRPIVYTVLLTIEYLGMPLGLAAGARFFDVTVGLPRASLRWVYVSSLLVAAAIVVGPQAYMSGPVANFAKVHTITIAAFLVPHALRWRDPTERLATFSMRAGLVSLFLGAVLDVLRSWFVWRVPEVMPIATVLFAFSQAVLVSMRHAAALTTAEHLLAEVDHANAELRDHGVLVDEFLQHASVELSEPSSAVVALAEGTAAAHGRRLGDELRHAFELIAQNGRRVTFLASEIGDMSRATDVEPASDPHAVDGELLVRRAAETVRPLLSRRRLDLRVTVEQGIPALFGEVSRVERAVASMLSYAVTYAESGQVVVALEGDGPMVLLTVYANGRFPDPGPLTSPFETVRRLAGAGLPATRIGLGLTTASRTAMHNGGRLTIQVTREVGVVLKLTLPAVSVSVADRIATGMGPRSARIALESAPARVVREGVSNGGRPVLVVDDDETNRTLLRQFLERQGFDVWLAADGESAIETIVSAGPPDLVLLDLGLPGLSGLHVLDVLRQRFDLAALPVLLLTARGMKEDMAEGFRRGASDYLVKPVAFDELDARIAHHVRIVDAYRVMRTELEMRRRYEGEIERAAQLAGQAEQTLQVLARERARIEGGSTGEREPDPPAE
jgi:DNA-binding response OmpR family regulator/signal transduction histidine kinase